MTFVKFLPEAGNHLLIRNRMIQQYMLVKTFDSSYPDVKKERRPNNKAAFEINFYVESMHEYANLGGNLLMRALFWKQVKGEWMQQLLWETEKKYKQEKQERKDRKTGEGRD